MPFKQSRFFGLKNFIFTFLRKKEFFQTFFINSFFLLFLGLFLGSLFGTFLDFPRSFGFWDGFLILFLIFVCEIINLFVYVYKSLFFRILNYLKLGFLLALFIDAFKVGS